MGNFNNYILLYIFIYMYSICHLNYSFTLSETEMFPVTGNSINMGQPYSHIRLCNCAVNILLIRSA